MNKINVTQEYGKLDKQLKKQLITAYPDGFKDHLVRYTNKDGAEISALRYETEDKVYLIRMTSQHALDIEEPDQEYDEEHLMDDPDL